MGQKQPKTPKTELKNLLRTIQSKKDKAKNEARKKK